MKGQITFLDVTKADEPDKRIKRNWENRFQRWSDKQAQDPATPLGKCGYGEICECCCENDHGRPCVRALNDMLRKKRKKIDYKTADYEKVWCGIF